MKYMGMMIVDAQDTEPGQIGSHVRDTIDDISDVLVCSLAYLVEKNNSFRSLDGIEIGSSVDNIPELAEFLRSAGFEIKGVPRT